MVYEDRDVAVRSATATPPCPRCASSTTWRWPRRRHAACWCSATSRAATCSTRWRARWAHDVRFLVSMTGRGVRRADDHRRRAPTRDGRSPWRAPTSGIDPADVVAFGDSETDIEMFRVAGASVAMGQAAPAVQDAATWVTTANIDDGVGPGDRAAARQRDGRRRTGTGGRSRVTCGRRVSLARSVTSRVQLRSMLRITRRRRRSRGAARTGPSSADVDTTPARRQRRRWAVHVGGADRRAGSGCRVASASNVSVAVTGDVAARPHARRRGVRPSAERAECHEHVVPRRVAQDRADRRRRSRAGRAPRCRAGCPIASSGGCRCSARRRAAGGRASAAGAAVLLHAPQRRAARGRTSPTARAPPTSRVHCGTAVDDERVALGLPARTSSCSTPSTISPRSAAIRSSAPRRPSKPGRASRGRGRRRRSRSCRSRKYSPPGTSPVSNDSPTSFERMCGRLPSGVIISISTASRHRGSTAGPVRRAVQRVVALQRLGAHRVARREHPARLAREEPERVGLEVAAHRLDDRVVVVRERAPVLPHERERARLVEAGRAGGRLVEVDLVGDVRRQHDVVADDRVGVGVEVADQVERAPVAPTRAGRWP